MKILKLILLSLLMLMATSSFATIYYSKNEAMELAFGVDAVIEPLSIFPDEDQVVKIEQKAKIKLESGLFTFYVGKNKDKILGYAAIETSTVRTKPETLLIVLSPEGELRSVYTLAFHEPSEYEPPQAWYEKLYKKSIDDMDFNKGVDGITGATLSTRTALSSIRKVMMIYQIMVKNKDSK